MINEYNIIHYNKICSKIFFISFDSKFMEIKTAVSPDDKIKIYRIYIIIAENNGYKSYSGYITALRNFIIIIVINSKRAN